MPPENALLEGRGALEPEIACNSEMIRDAELISGNIPDTSASLEREIMRNVQRMAKTVCGHGDVLSEVACMHSDSPRKCRHRGSWRRPHVP